MTQSQRIIEYVNAFGSITPLEAFKDLGITKLATRISEMRRNGYLVDIERCKSTNRFGEPVNYAKYSNIRRDLDNERY